MTVQVLLAGLLCVSVLSLGLAGAVIVSLLPNWRGLLSGRRPVLLPGTRVMVHDGSIAEILANDPCRLMITYSIRGVQYQARSYVLIASALRAPRPTPARREALQGQLSHFKIKKGMVIHAEEARPLHR